MATGTSTGGRITAPDHQLPPHTEATATRGNGHARVRPSDGSAGLGDLVRELSDDMDRLVRDEVALAKQEGRQKLRKMAADSGWIAAGAGVVIAGALCLVAALALGLGALFGAWWLGALITGVLLLIVGSVVALKGLQDFRSGELAPRKTVETLKQDAAWAKGAAARFRRELAGR